MCPCSGFWYPRSVFCILVPVFGTVVPFFFGTLVPVLGVQGTSDKTTLLETNLLQTPNTSTRLPELQKALQTRKLRKSASEIQKSNSETSGSVFRISKAEFPCRTLSGGFGVVAQKVQETTFTVVVWTLEVVVRRCFCGLNRATQKLHLRISEAQTQKLVFQEVRVGLSESESDLQSFRFWGFSPLTGCIPEIRFAQTC